MLEQRGHAIVVERRRGGAEHRHVLGLGAERLAVADELAADVTQRVLGAAALELVDRDDVGEVEHVDLLELRGGAELRRHDVHRFVDIWHDRGVALADAGGLDDHEVVAGGLEQVDDDRQAVGQLVAAAGRERAEVDAVAVERVHPDAVAEQRAATAATGRVDGDDADAELVLLVEAEPAYELVGQRRLAGAAGAGDAEHRGARRGRRGADRVEERRVEPVELGSGDGAGEGAALAGQHGVGGRLAIVPEIDVARLDHRVDHAGEAEALPVLGGEDRDAGVAESRDLLGDDHAATTAVDLDVPGAPLAQRLDEVLEVLDVAALVGADRDALHVLVDRRVDDLLDGPVVAEVDDLGALRLQDAAHDVDRGVVAVEQRRRGDETDGVGRGVEVLRAHATSISTVRRYS